MSLAGSSNQLTMSPEIRILRPGDQSLLESVATGVFDHAVDPDLAAEVLRDPRHHLAVALDGGRVVGFASGVHYVHPDKPAELWVNEVGVAESHRGRGLGKAVLRALLRHGRRLGCREAWVLTDQSNNPARRLYASTGGRESPEQQVMFSFSLHRDDHDERTG
jgi:aminoglycoside 6'-N-acetyltransferase I